jgi:hypothetical protein
MRNRGPAACLAFALTFAAGTAHAQAWGWNVGLGGGVTIPTGDMADVAGTGWHTGVAIEWRKVGAPWGIRVSGDFHRFGLSDDLGLDGNIELWRWSGDFLYHFGGSENLQPYVLGGLGYVNADVEVDDEVGVVSFPTDGRLDIIGGVGAVIPMGGRLGVNLEARYELATGDGGDITYIPLSVRIRF